LSYSNVYNIKEIVRGTSDLNLGVRIKQEKTEGLQSTHITTASHSSDSEHFTTASDKGMAAAISNKHSTASANNDPIRCSAGNQPPPLSNELTDSSPPRVYTAKSNSISSIFRVHAPKKHTGVSII
jgi:hypothetical protein